MAANEVINILELREKVLLELPLRYLLRARSLSRAFKHTIDGTNAMKRKKFLLATPHPPPSTEYRQSYRRYLDKITKLNPLLVCYQPDDGMVPRHTWRGYEAYRNHYPMLFPGSAVDDFKDHGVVLSRNADRWSGKSGLLKMFITQPPEKRIKLELMQRVGLGETFYKSWIGRFEDGVTLENIIEGLVEIKEWVASDQHAGPRLGCANTVDEVKILFDENVAVMPEEYWMPEAMAGVRSNGGLRW